MNLHAQINVPQDTQRVYITDTFVFVGNYDSLKLEELAIDTVMYVTNKKPYFIDDNFKINRDKKWDDGIYYEPKTKLQYRILRSGRVEVWQVSRRSKFMLVDKPIEQKIYHGLKDAKKNKEKSVLFWEKKHIKDMLHPIVKVIIVKDSTKTKSAEIK